MLGEATHLDRESQTIPAAWASLKAMVAEFSDPATRATEVADFERMHKALQSTCDHQGAHMKVVTVRDFRDHATEMFRSDDVILVTREGTPAGFFLPWNTPELPVEVRREVFLRLSEQIGAELKAKGISEPEVLGDFAASRSRS